MQEQVINLENRSGIRGHESSTSVFLEGDMRKLLLQTDLSSEEMELVSKLVLEVTENILRGMVSLKDQGMDVYELRERLSQTDFIPPRLHVARLGLGDDYTVRFAPEAHIGQVVEIWRKYRKYPGVRLSRDAGLNETYVFMLEHRRIEEPSLDALERIAYRLEVDVEDLLVHRIPVLIDTPKSS